ncbi:hypothetical protein PR202_gb16455 [Eleusine coracana subsp. coracana]|uniref:RING-type E3 ubiquitin transferase n=1 Tax=Eleusine coracana subsp. coracana TaxID=191504 RepID=A0AAV5F1J0_ELECO|nr:hypothetical protein QOZ80_9BG0697990 [Eleusine coracana subsp. coracana]GJN28345.1 hypothetical protein PR202_gb16455 [Eleusine coracana subsp. coracana]
MRMDRTEGQRRLAAELLRAKTKAAWEASLIKHLQREEQWRQEQEDEEYYDSITCNLVPAARKAILGLYQPRWGETREERDGGCAICLEDLQVGQKFRMMPCCCHAFHQRCIFEWLIINRVCPICQSPMPSEEEQRRLDEQAAARARDRDDRDVETDELVGVD